jgi:hypothetical protein
METQITYIYLARGAQISRSELEEAEPISVL